MRSNRRPKHSLHEVATLGSSHWGNRFVLGLARGGTRSHQSRSPLAGFWIGLLAAEGPKPTKLAVLANLEDSAELSKENSPCPHSSQTSTNLVLANMSELTLVDPEALPVGADTRKITLERARHDGAGRNRGAQA